YGPYNPAEVTAGSQPDWYMGVAEGLLRIMPGWESYIFGFTVSWNVFIPGVVAPGIIFGAVLMYPFIEEWITGDKREHHLLQRPRNAPTRTAFMVSMMTLYGLLWAAGGNDIIAFVFNLNLNQITYFMRVAVFVGPVIAFIITRRWCVSLQRQDEGQLLHGYETGVIMRAPEGGYSERHLPISAADAYTLTARDRDRLVTVPDGTDENGVAAPGARKERLRAKLSRFWFGDNVQKPTRQELEDAREHAQHELEERSDGHQHMPAGDYLGAHELDGRAADGHQFDGRHGVDEETLRQH
ncbi:MAG: ubiquinol-cytochrome c reductase cytochrome b subunit, partial [Nocardioidaceae bacterium]